MMRILFLVLMASVMPFAAHAAQAADQAADDFGQRFGNSAPSALADEVNPEDLQSIEPAAGAPAEQTAVENAIDPVIPATPESAAQTAPEEDKTEDAQPAN